MDRPQRDLQTTLQSPGRRHSTGTLSFTQLQERRAAMARRSSVNVDPTLTSLDEEHRSEIARIHLALRQASALARLEGQTASQNHPTTPSAPLIRFANLVEEPLPLQPLEPIRIPPSLQRRPTSEMSARRRESLQAAWIDHGSSGSYNGRALRRVRLILAFFGYGPNNRRRREFVSLLWTVCFGFVQVRWSRSRFLQSG